MGRLTRLALRGIAHARSVPKLAALFLPSLWLAACASVPTTGLGCAAGKANCTFEAKPKVVVDADEWKNANYPIGLMVLIQSNMDRVSAGQSTWPAPKGVTPDPLLQIVDAYDDFLHSDFSGMDASIAKAEQAADKLHAGLSPRRDTTSNWKSADAKFYKDFTAAMHSPLPLVRLYAALRDVDGSLFNEMVDGDPLDRKINPINAVSAPEDGAWVRLPCRTVIGRVSQFVAATDMLKSLGGPVLDCPVDDQVDYARDEALALNPKRLSPHVTPPPTAHNAADTSGTPKSPLPGSRDAALAEMDTHPLQAAPILEHYSHVDALGELDYALFLHAFEPETPARDTTIRALQADLQKKAMASHSDLFDHTLYDGTDASLLSIIRAASVAQVANSESAFYAIPCAILIARPGLIAATDEYWGSNMDNFMPRSGCNTWWGRGGTISGFPDKAVDAFEAASTRADGDFIATFQGSMRSGFAAAKNSTNEKMKLDPRSFLNPDPPPFGYPSLSFDYPYQVWGYTSLNNYVVSLDMRKLYLVAHEQLATYYQKRMQLSQADSEQAAKAALFLATFGGNCGGDVPATSLRRMLLEHASLSDITQQLSDGGGTDAAEIAVCAKDASLDPLLLVAVGDPDAFSLVMQHESDINERNAIGKTALMEAAQFNQVSIVNLLLLHHAEVNATTGGYEDKLPISPLADDLSPLANDARNALMYAAANSSLDVIKVLLEAGADPYQADTKGYRAIDYLLGYGPTPPNPHLSAHQREQAALWLF